MPASLKVEWLLWTKPLIFATVSALRRLVCITRMIKLFCYSGDSFPPPPWINLGEWLIHINKQDSEWLTWRQFCETDSSQRLHLNRIMKNLHYDNFVKTKPNWTTNRLWSSRMNTAVGLRRLQDTLGMDHAWLLTVLDWWPVKLLPLSWPYFLTWKRDIETYFYYEVLSVSWLKVFFKS